MKKRYYIASGNYGEINVWCEITDGAKQTSSLVLAFSVTDSAEGIVNAFVAFLNKHEADRRG